MKLPSDVFKNVGNYINDAQTATLALVKTKYKANRNPAVAALYDGDPLVRAGASILLAATYENSGRITPNTIPVLKMAIQREKDRRAKAVMEAMLKRIETKTLREKYGF